MNEAQIDGYGAAIAKRLGDKTGSLKDYEWPFPSRARKAAVLAGYLPRGSDEETRQDARSSRLFELTELLRENISKLATNRNVDNEALCELARFVITEWGGLRNHRSETIPGYVKRFTDTSKAIPLTAITSADLMVQRAGSGVFEDFEGVASWSKWLNFVWPGWALIYDSKVAWALNAVHFLERLDVPLFPVPPGRSGILAALDSTSLAAIRRLRASKPVSLQGMELEKAKRTLSGDVVLKRDSYTTYLKVMAVAHAQLWPAGTPFVHTEMLLFYVSDHALFVECADDVIGNGV